jgi:uncharacterized DUF497 family protein
MAINHGSDFADASWIFDESMLVYEDVRKNYGEKRFCGIGIIQDIEISIVYTKRKNKIRIISARRARTDERQKYRSIYSAQSSKGKNGLD